MPKKLLTLIILIVGVGLIISLSRDIWRLLRADDWVTQARLQVEELEKRNLELKELKDYYQSEEFVEEQARNKLNLAREGETVVILPPNVSELLGQQETKEPEEIPGWQQWWNLFF